MLMLHIKVKEGKFMNICVIRKIAKIRPISARSSASFVFNGIVVFNGTSASKIKYFSEVSR